MTSIVDALPKLYNAGVSYMVANKSEEDAWKEIAATVHSLNLSLIDIEEIKKLFKSAEEQIKKDFSIKNMPAKWRSAKSVALKAAENKIGLMVDGAVVAKTATEKLIKERLDMLPAPALKVKPVTSNKLILLAQELYSSITIFDASGSRLNDLEHSTLEAILNSVQACTRIIKK